MTTRLELDLDATAGTPREVRRAVAARFATHPCIDELLLCLSEVVTNAVLHAGTAVSVTAASHRDDEGREVVRVEVTDRSPVLPIRRRFEKVSPTGRGLQLLDQLTSRWGVDAHETGKTVWFEVAGPGGTSTGG